MGRGRFEPARNGTTRAVLWVVVRRGPRVWYRKRVLNPLRRAVLGDAVGVSGQDAIDRRRVAQQVGAVGAGAGPEGLDATREVRRGRPGRDGAPRCRSIQVSCKRGIPLDLGSVVHQRRRAVDDDAAVTAEWTE